MTPSPVTNSLHNFSKTDGKGLKVLDKEEGTLSIPSSFVAVSRQRCLFQKHLLATNDVNTMPCRLRIDLLSS